jgi:hypothetical protein
VLAVINRCFVAFLIPKSGKNCIMMHIVEISAQGFALIKQLANILIVLAV